MSTQIKGFTKVPHSVVEYWMSNLKGVEFKVLILIIRKTKGYHKESDQIAISQFEKFTGSSKNAVIKSIQSLEKKGLIQKSRGLINTYIFRDKYLTPRIKIAPGKSKNMTSMVQKEDTQKKHKESKENSRSGKVVKDLISQWNELYKQKLNDEDESDKLMVTEALKKFNPDFIKTAMIGRLYDSYYIDKKPQLKDSPSSFFKYIQTIKNDHDRLMCSILSYKELLDKVDSRQIIMDDYQLIIPGKWIRKDCNGLLKKYNIHLFTK